MEHTLDVDTEGLEHRGEREVRPVVAGPPGGFLHHAAQAGGVQLPLERHRVQDEEVVREFCWTVYSVQMGPDMEETRDGLGKGKGGCTRTGLHVF